MISKKIAEALNRQVAKEAFAVNSYLSMASWCEQQGLRGCAVFFYEQSEEEKGHMMKLFKYINEAGGHAIAPEIKEPSHSYKSITHVFSTALEHERGVSASINKLVEFCFNSKDFASFHFLQWYVEEQVEEENLFKSILDMIKLAGGETSKNLLFIDGEIRRLKEKK